MELPAITLPNIELPFDIPVLLHPPVDHFAIALPVVIILVELINLVARKRSLSMLSLFFIVLMVVALLAAYLTGTVDAKETFDLLSESGQAELKEHKLLGTYLVYASGILLVFKLLSMLMGKALVQMVYLLFLVLFVAGMFNQGNEGGELVYEHGANVEKVKILDDKIFDLEEALEEAAEETEEREAPADTNKTETAPIQPAVPAVKGESAEEAAPKTAPAETLPAEPSATELKEKAVPEVKEKLKVEGMPEEMVQPEIATH